MIESWYPESYTFASLLDEIDYAIDNYIPIENINFSKDIYPKLLKMHKELSIYK